MKSYWRSVLPVPATDAVVSLAALWIAYTFRFRFDPTTIPGGEIPAPGRYIAAAPIVGLVVIGVFLFMGVYVVRRGQQFIDEIFAVLKAMAVTVVVVFALIGLYRQGEFTYSRLTFVYWALVATVMLLIARYVLRRIRTRRWERGEGVDRVVVVGSGAAADLVLQRIRMFPDYGYKVVGLITDSKAPAKVSNSSDVLGATGDLRRVIDEQKVNLVFVAEPELSQDRILELVDSCRDCGVDFRIVPSMLEIMTSRVAADQLDGIPLLQFRHGLDVDAAKATSKRVLDVVISGLGMILISPLLLVIAILIRATSPGPVLIHQERSGLDEKPMLMHKFRTMRVDAEAASGPVWTSASDPRRTAVGRFLRRFSLDELPQLWNVLIGEMSLVGPRPERPHFVDEFKDRVQRYADRHLVRPGVTGWAQVNDLRGQTSVEERLIYDLYYIENWSLAFDLKIILITLFRIFTSKNAY
ncbi:MAG: undecaprenyl-phosphate glucose phosphotransferase [Chloroflexi bacterium]|nr:MAG: undecaprenyl-phosphate glucose phosphotransferase [Chloroflexota bacterium]